VLRGQLGTIEAIHHISSSGSHPMQVHARPRRYPAQTAIACEKLRLNTIGRSLGQAGLAGFSLIRVIVLYIYRQYRQ
jgi:L-cystine uptake protein TcyP (sodium:dicarboxylate symporter family)